jgi:hypothetical protein
LSAALYGKRAGLSNQILLSSNKFPLFLSDELRFPTILLEVESGEAEAAFSASPLCVFGNGFG